MKRADIEGVGTKQPRLLSDGEAEFEADSSAFNCGAPRKLEQHCDRGLVVGAEDRVSLALPAAINDHGNHRPFVWNGVKVRAEEHRLRRVRTDPRQQVAALSADSRGRAILLYLYPNLLQFAAHVGGHRALRARRAGNRT